MNLPSAPLRRMKAPGLRLPVVEILRMVTEAEPTPIEERNPKVHPLLISTIKRMMRKKREDRYQSAQELAEELIRIAPEIPAD